MTNRVLLCPLLLLPFLLAGCSDGYETRRDGIGFDYKVDYDGSLRGDDNDLYVSYKFPIGEDDSGHRLDNLPDRPDGGRGIAFDCPAQSKEWGDKPYWVELSLYEEENGEFINRQRWDADCLQYWVEIDERGDMTLHKGEGPWLRNKGLPAFGALATVTGIAVLAAVARRRR